jgi:hypothetical protein
MNSNTKLSFVTYFSKEFLIQGVVAIESFLRSHEQASGLVVCLDATSKSYLKKKHFGERIEVLDVSEIGDINTVFKFFLDTRTYTESIISLKPYLIEMQLQRTEPNEYLIYFDADIFFFNSMLSIDEFRNGFEVLLSQHLFPIDMTESVKFGKFNGGMVIFRNSGKSQALLSQWKAQCTEWCKLELFEDRFADQKYLDAFPVGTDVIALKHPGVNNGQYYFREKRNFGLSHVGKGVLIDGFSLSSFHFHGIRVHSKSISSGFNRYGTPRNFFWVLFSIYAPYLKMIRVESQVMRLRYPDIWAQVVGRDRQSRKGQDFLQLLRLTKIPHKLHVFGGGARVVR